MAIELVGSDLDLQTEPAAPRVVPDDGDGPAATLTEMLYDGRFETCHRPLAELLGDERFRRVDGSSPAERARHAYSQLRTISRDLGPARTLVRDPQQLFALFEWSAIFAGDLLSVLSGHYNLTVGALLALGAGREDLECELDDLDAASSAGVFLLTELGYGSNVFELETEAVYDPATRTFVLHTPSAAAQKFMPNVAADDVGKLVVIAARLKVSGEDCGVFPFLLRLRNEKGTLHQGVHVTPMPETPFFAMDNAVISFDHAVLPYRSLLTGEIAELTPDGKFVCDVEPRLRYRHTIEPLQSGRIALSSATVASARAALLIAIRYAAARSTAGPAGRPVRMLEHRLVQRGLLTGLARIYAATLLANRVKRAFADESADGERRSLLAMAAKPMLSWTAMAVLQECRERCGAQGVLSLNRIADYLGACQGVITAEGENQVLQLTAGRRLVHQPSEPVPVPVITGLEEVESWRYLLAERERRLRDDLATSLNAGRGRPGDRLALINDHASRFADLADAHAHRLALEELLHALETIGHDARAADLLRALAGLFVLHRLERHAGWYLTEGLLETAQVRTLDARIDAECAALAPSADIFIDAFGIPERQLRVPIASADYLAAWDLRAGAQGGQPARR